MRRDRVRLARSFTALDVGSDVYAFRSEAKTIRFDDPLLYSSLLAIIPLLDGTRNIEQVVLDSALKPTFAAEILSMLDQHHLLEPAEGNTSFSALRGFLRQTGHEPDRLIDHLSRSRIWILGIGPVFRSLLEVLSIDQVGHGFATEFGARAVGPSVLETANGLRWQTIEMPRGNEEFAKILDDCELILTISDRLLHDQFALINRAALLYNKKWLFTLLQGSTGFVGPTIRPFKTACYCCMDLRLRGNLADPKVYDSFINTQDILSLPQAAPTLPVVPRLLANSIVLEIIKLLLPEVFPASNDVGIATQTEYQFLGGRMRIHQILKLPRCPACGKPKPRLQLRDTTVI